MQSVFHFYMSRQAQSEAPRDYGCLSHAVGASAARQRGEVVRDDNNQTSRLRDQGAEEAAVPHSGSRDDNGEVFVGRADVEELVEWWQDQEEGWDSDAVLDEWDSVRTGDGFTEVHATEFFPESADDRPLDPEGQLLVWDRHVLLRDLRGAVQQVPVHMDRDYRQFAAWCPHQLETVIFIAGATVLLNNVSLRDLGVVPGMLLEMRAQLTWGAGDSHPMAALAIFCVQKYETRREYLAGSPMTAGVLTRAIEKMVGRFAGDLPSLLRNVNVTCPGLEPEQLWTLLGCFETYAGALLDFSVMRYVRIRREEYHDAEDWDALQEARREYDEVEHHVRLEGANRKEQDGHLRDLDSSDEEDEERPYEVLNLENVRKIRKRPGAPKWTVRLSEALRDYLQKPERAEEHSLANAIWEVMRKMDRQGSAYLKEEWKKKNKKEKKRRRKERKKAKKAGHKSTKGKGRKSKDGSLVCMWNAMPVRPMLAFVAAFVCPANDSRFEPRVALRDSQCTLYFVGPGVGVRDSQCMLCCVAPPVGVRHSQSTLCCVVPPVGVRNSQSTLGCVVPRVGVSDSQSTLGCVVPRVGVSDLDARFVACPLGWGLGPHNPRFVAWSLELGLAPHDARFVACPLEWGLGTHNPRFFAWSIELRLGTHNPRFVVWPLELGLGTHNPRFVVWPLKLGLGTHNARFVVWPLKLGVGTHNPRFVVWHLDLGLGTHNPRFVAWSLELALGTHNAPLVAWPLKLGLGTHNPHFVVWPLEWGLGTHNARLVVWPLELGLGTHNPRFVVWPLDLGLGTPNPGFVAWSLEFALGTHNAPFVAWPLKLGLGTHNPHSVVWPLEWGLGTHNPRFVAWSLELGLATYDARFVACPLGFGVRDSHSPPCCVVPRGGVRASQCTLCFVAPRVGVRESQCTLCCVAPRVGVCDS